MTDKPTIEEIERQISVTNEEILDHINKANPAMVQAVAESLQNQKMKAFIRDHFGDSEEG